MSIASEGFSRAAGIRASSGAATRIALTDGIGQES